MYVWTACSDYAIFWFTYIAIKETSMDGQQW